MVRKKNTEISSQENIALLDEILEYRKTSHKKDQILLALEIFTFFLEEDSIYQINCKSQTKNIIMETLKKNPQAVDDHLFDNLYREIYTIMNDTLLRFLESELYRDYLKDKENINKKMPLKAQKMHLSSNSVSMEHITRLSNNISQIDWDNI